MWYYLTIHLHSVVFSCYRDVAGLVIWRNRDSMADVLRTIFSCQVFEILPPTRMWYLQMLRRPQIISTRLTLCTNKT
jgi:hypothetical protein